jgi:hypothetical protein
MIKIINTPCLPYKVIGQIIDDLIEKEPVTTIYVGKIEYFEFVYKDQRYKCQIRYMKRDVEWSFVEVGNE